MPRGRKLTDKIPAHAQSLYALGVAFAIYGIAVGLPPEGNGFIAVFTGAITLGILRPDLRTSFEDRADDIVEIVKLGDLRRVRRAADDRRAVHRRLGGGRRGRLHAARGAPVAVWIALAGTGSTPRPRPSWRGSAPRAWPP